MNNSPGERRPDWKDISEVRSTAERALTLINAHEVTCAERYGQLKKTADGVAGAMKWVHIGIGICVSTQFFVGLYVALHH